MRTLSRLSRSSFSAAAGALKRSPLHDVHIGAGGKLVGFAGWELPVQYAGAGVMAETLHTREAASIFDLRVHGPRDARVKFLEGICVGSIGALKPDQGQYTLLTNESGGIIDDAVFVNRESHTHIVCNAACSEKDIAHLTEQISVFNKANGGSQTVELEIISDQALVAVQGPYAEQLVAGVVDKPGDRDALRNLSFFYSANLTLAGAECIVSRSGYTGEDGFEISIPIPSSRQVVDELLHDQKCKLAGLGARDALRLEAGLCLYGHDLDDTTTPIEAGLAWAIGKRRRKEGGFLGDGTILAQLNGTSPVTRTRVGLVIDGAPAREGAEIVSENGSEVGCITSGGFSPVLKRPIAMGYISTDESSEPGHSLGVRVRGKVYSAKVSELPFVPTKYVKKLKPKSKT
ncbi:hypothetical protein PBRA_005559 [Plasmodiophora brassicae]|uniref:Aminomethyltransferase n=1 Tax=Plasmodiophora brassicae TaxID=37360 RepID=A0A0G4IP60_PLABS|nr:hypothetical protein PBRA_005559 [Plasmodiophora brassicae]